MARSEQPRYQPETPAAQRSPQEKVVRQLLALMEESDGNWLQTWASAGAVQNAFSGRRYQLGVNTLILALRMQRSAWADPRFGTFKQIQTAGGRVRKGEKGTHILGYFPIYAPAAPDDPGEDPADERAITGYRYKTLVVFNILAQTEGIPLAPLIPTATVFTPIERCEQVVGVYPNPPVIRLSGSDHAYYQPSQDTIHLPLRELFRDEVSYYATLFHELVHSTGHERRLGRKGVSDRALFGSHAYSFEELVAEIGAVLLANHSGIEPDMANSARYLKGWVRKFQEDTLMILKAAGEAKQAVAHILDEG